MVRSFIPKATALLLGGGMFAGGGLEKVFMPHICTPEIRESKFYTWSCKYLGIPFDKNPSLLDAFTRSLGAVMTVCGVLFAANLDRRNTSLVMCSILAAFNLFVHVDLDDPKQTTPFHIAHFGFNVLLGYCYLYMGGWVRGGGARLGVLAANKKAAGYLSNYFMGAVPSRPSSLIRTSWN